MSAVWITVAGLTVATAAIKASGPVLLGGRDLPRPFLAVIALLAPALLAALVVTETFGADGGGLTVDARAAGLASAGGALALRASLIVTVLAAAAVTAAVRALG